jgi:lysophospholipase L1-like esterase
LIRVLCYGDSNTWGQVPYRYERQPPKNRWTGILQSHLNNVSQNSNFKFDIIEEGLCGRLAGNLDSKDTYLNGLDGFLPTLISQYPVEYVVIALGTNDLKSDYDQSAKSIVSNLWNYTEKINELFPNDDIQVIYLTPPMLALNTSQFTNTNEKIQSIYSLLKDRVEHGVNLQVIDLSNFKVSGADLLHFDLKNHKEIGKLVCDKIIEKYDPQRFRDRLQDKVG